VKKLTNLQHVRLATPPKVSPTTKSISSAAVCAGSGSTVLRNQNADVLVTGEMSHHEVLDAISKGSAVILCDHSNTERGFLKVLAEKLGPLLPNVELVISKVDADPLVIV